MSEQPQGEALYRRDPQKKVRDEDWPVIRSLVEKGMPQKEVAAKFGISPLYVSRKASDEKWITPMRLARAKKGLVPTHDPASAVVSIWAERSDAMRESVYQGAKKSLERFFAMSPVPQSFAEAATAHKLLKDSIDPSGGANTANSSVTQILQIQGFTPKPAIDV